jgi:hypothetical protein
VDYQGAGQGSAFDGVDAGYSFMIEGVGAETVDGFGGESYEATGSEEAGGTVDFCGTGGLPSLRHRQL